MELSNGRSLIEGDTLSYGDIVYRYGRFSMPCLYLGYLAYLNDERHVVQLTHGSSIGGSCILVDTQTFMREFDAFPSKSISDKRGNAIRIGDKVCNSWGDAGVIVGWNYGMRALEIELEGEDELCLGFAHLVTKCDCDGECAIG